MWTAPRCVTKASDFPKSRLPPLPFKHRIWHPFVAGYRGFPDPHVGRFSRYSQRVRYGILCGGIEPEFGCKPYLQRAECEWLNASWY
jgi:hypothetical protein